MGKKKPKSTGRKPLVGIRMDEDEQARLDDLAKKLASRSGGSVPNRADVLRLGIKLVEQSSSTRPSHMRIPIIGMTAAGPPTDPNASHDDYLEVGDLFPEGCVALRVKGSSMLESQIQSGDLAIVRPTDDVADVGDEVVVWKSEEGLMLKKLGQHRHLKISGEWVPLESGDRIVGVLVGVIRKV